MYVEKTASTQKLYQKTCQVNVEDEGEQTVILSCHILSYPILSIQCYNTGFRNRQISRTCPTLRLRVQCGSNKPSRETFEGLARNKLWWVI